MVIWEEVEAGAPLLQITRWEAVWAVEVDSVPRAVRSAAALLLHSAQLLAVPLSARPTPLVGVSAAVPWAALEAEARSEGPAQAALASGPLLLAEPLGAAPLPLEQPPQPLPSVAVDWAAVRSASPRSRLLAALVEASAAQRRPLPSGQPRLLEPLVVAEGRSAAWVALEVPSKTSKVVLEILPSDLIL